MFAYNLENHLNQIVVVENNGIKTFLSYGKVIVVTTSNMTYLDQKYYNFSNTTIKHRNTFLKVNNKTFKRKLEQNDYILTNLN